MSNTIPNTPSETISLDGSSQAKAASIASASKASDNVEESDKGVANLLELRMVKRLFAIEESLRGKELLMLRSIRSNIPKAYYRRWKQESNSIISLYVRLKHRLKNQK